MSDGSMLVPPVTLNDGRVVIIRRLQSDDKARLLAFGEALPQLALQRAFAAAAECDLLMSVGTSGLVYPAAQVPQIALRNGAQVVHINPQPVISSSPREHSVQGAAGVVLPHLMHAAFAG